MGVGMETSRVGAAQLFSSPVHCTYLEYVRYWGLVIYCESGFQFKCFVRHVEINRSRCYNRQRRKPPLLSTAEKDEEDGDRNGAAHRVVFPFGCTTTHDRMNVLYRFTSFSPNFPEIKMFLGFLNFIQSFTFPIVCRGEGAGTNENSFAFLFWSFRSV